MTMLFDAQKSSGNRMLGCSQPSIFFYFTTIIERSYVVVRVFQIVISNPFQSSSFSAILVPLCCRINPLGFFFLSKPLFYVSRHLNRNLGRTGNDSKYYDIAHSTRKNKHERTRHQTEGFTRHPTLLVFHTCFTYFWWLKNRGMYMYVRITSYLHHQMLFVTSNKIQFAVPLFVLWTIDHRYDNIKCSNDKHYWKAVSLQTSYLFAYINTFFGELRWKLFN